MTKTVINKEKMIEGEFHPSKDIPDVLEDGRILTVYWTVLGRDAYSFVSIEDACDNYGILQDNSEDDEDEDFKILKPHNFCLYGALHGKIYPWQVELADLGSRLQVMVKTDSRAAAQVKMFEKAQAIMDTIAVGTRKEASLQQKMVGWKSVAHIETLLSKDALKKAWFTSRHAAAIKRWLEDGILTDEEAEMIEYDFSNLTKTRMLLRRASKKVKGQLSLFEMNPSLA